VAARALRFDYPSGRRGLAEVDLVVQPGERVVILGPNGSGKSTLIQLLAGLLTPGAGHVEVLGRDPAAGLSLAGARTRPRGTADRSGGTRAARGPRRVAVALDRVVHWEPLSALDNLLLLAQAAGLARREAAELGGDLLARFQVDGRVPVRELSLGMKRKLLLAETLVGAPDLLLLDEPTLGLDPEGVATLAAVLDERGAAGTAAVVASNDVRAAALLGSRAVFLLEGRKVADDTPEALLAALGSRTRLEVTLAETGRPRLALLSDGAAPGGMELRLNGTVLVAESPAGAEPLPELLRWLLDRGAVVRDVRVREQDLGDVFRHLTGRPLEERS
jgi:ABC-2 type transport system ATP-binding protein